MVDSERATAQIHGSDIHPFGVRVAALSRVERRQAVEAEERIRMQVPQDFATNLQGCHVKRLSLGVPALAQVQTRKVIQAAESFLVFIAEDPTTDFERTGEERFGLRVLPLQRQ